MPDGLSTEAKDYVRIIDGRLREALIDVETIVDLLPRGGEFNRRRGELREAASLIEMAREDLGAVSHRITRLEAERAEADEIWLVLNEVMNFLAGSGRVKHDPELRHLLDDIYPKWGDHA